VPVDLVGALLGWITADAGGWAVKGGRDLLVGDAAERALRKVVLNAIDVAVRTTGLVGAEAEHLRSVLLERGAAAQIIHIDSTEDLKRAVHAWISSLSGPSGTQEDYLGAIGVSSSTLSQSLAQSILEGIRDDARAGGRLGMLADWLWRDDTTTAIRSIQQTVSSLAALHPPPAEPPLRSLDPPLALLPPRLRGRDVTLKDLWARLALHKASFIVLHGIGGAGKTTVALALARDAQQSGVSVFWVRPENSDQAMLEVARRLGADDRTLALARQGTVSAPDLVWSYLERSATPWMIVFDNVDDPAEVGPQGILPSEGTGWIRPSGRGMVLVTSRQGRQSTWGTNAVLVRLEPLSDADGARILLDLAPNAGSEEDARQLARALGCLPLALRIAGSHLGENPLEVRTFAEYRRAFSEDLAHLEGLASTAIESLGSARSLLTQTWSISLSQLKKRGMPEAEMFLRLLASYNSGTPIPLSLLDWALLTRGLIVDEAMGTNFTRVREVLQAMADLALIDPSVVQQRSSKKREVFVQLHPVVRESLLATTKPTDRIGIWRCGAQHIAYALTQFEPSRPESWLPWTTISTHARSLVSDHPAGASTEVLKVLEELVNAADHVVDTYSHFIVYQAFAKAAYEVYKPGEELPSFAVIPLNEAFQGPVHHLVVGAYRTKEILDLEIDLEKLPLRHRNARLPRYFGLAMLPILEVYEGVNKLQDGILPGMEALITELNARRGDDSGEAGERPANP
jgi:hypothetical protein